MPALSRRPFHTTAAATRSADGHAPRLGKAEQGLIPLVADGWCDRVQVGWQRQFWPSNRGGSGFKTRTATNGEARRALPLLECARPLRNQNIARAAVC